MGWGFKAGRQWHFFKYYYYFFRYYFYYYYYLLIDLLINPTTPLTLVMLYP